MSNTKYLDDFLLDDKGCITKEVMDAVKDYCGLFAFISSICNNESLSPQGKSKLIRNIIEASLKFMAKRYTANLNLYKKQVTNNLKSGKLFEALSEIPAKMQEDYEMGIEDARHFIYVEVRDILRILQVDLDI
jgi:hypothetical protein